MDYKNFVYKEDAYAGFVELRKLLNSMIENPQEYDRTFDEAFDEAAALALGGNPIAQDVIAYYYKSGVPGVIPENYDLYMKWQILAAANGNEFAIEKLQFFLNYAFTEVITEENLNQIIQKNDINERNYFYVIGNLLCEGVVDAMGISAEKLVKEKLVTIKYTPERLRSYKRELEKVVPKIVEYLLA